MNAKLLFCAALCLTLNQVCLARPGHGLSNKSVWPSEPADSDESWDDSWEHEHQKPVEPQEPVKPHEPEEPVKPFEPQEPEEPVKPVEPEEPVKPVEPQEPVTPVVPQEPDSTQKPPQALSACKENLKQLVLTVVRLFKLHLQAVKEFFSGVLHTVKCFYSGKLVGCSKQAVSQTYQTLKSLVSDYVQQVRNLGSLAFYSVKTCVGRQQLEYIQPFLAY